MRETGITTPVRAGNGKLYSLGHALCFGGGGAAGSQLPRSGRSCTHSLKVSDPEAGGGWSSGGGGLGERGRGADAISDLDVCALCRQHRNGESQVTESPAPWREKQCVVSKGGLAWVVVCADALLSPGSSLCKRERHRQVSVSHLETQTG